MQRVNFTVILLFLFLFFGVACILLRLDTMKKAPPLSPESHWRISYIIKFNLKGTEARCRVAIPSGNALVRIDRETFSHSRLNVSFRQDEETSERRILLLPTERSTSVRFEAQFDMIVDGRTKGYPTITEGLDQETRRQYLGDEEGIHASSPTVMAVLEEIRKGETDQDVILSRIFEHSANLAGAKVKAGERARKEAFSGAVYVLSSRRATVLGRARAMVALSRAAKIPARPVTGFLLSHAQVKQPHHWVEVHLDGQWIPFDPELKRLREGDAVYVPVLRGRAKVVEARNVRDLFSRTTVKSIAPPTGVAESAESRWLAILDFTRLPPAMSDTVALVLLIPLGGLITAIFRHLFGIVAFGYFSTTLIALSFTDVPWRMAVIVFVVIMTIGLSGRALLDKLDLHKLPRLALVLLLIVLSLTITVSLLEFLNIRPSSRGVLLPMISLTMIIERFHVNFEEKGYRAAFTKLGATLLVAFACLLIFSIDQVQWSLLSFPETEFLIAFLLVLVGRYRRGEAKPPVVEPAQPDLQGVEAQARSQH